MSGPQDNRPGSGPPPPPFPPPRLPITQAMRDEADAAGPPPPEVIARLAPIWRSALNDSGRDVGRPEALVSSGSMSSS